MNTKAQEIGVDWYEYARKYDLLLTYNPYYQQLHRQVLQYLADWEVEPGDKLLDAGAGTGNYSVEMARLFPTAQVFHLENNGGMNAIARRKAAGLSNFELLSLPIEEAGFKEGSLRGLLCINALYTFPSPKRMMEKMHRWLAPGGRAVFVDPGRAMNVLSWRMAIGWHLLSNYGLRRAFQVFREARAVAEQNAYIREMQRSGLFWTHSHEEFCEAVKQAGFHIDFSGLCFRGDCDLVYARKEGQYQM